MRTAHTLHLHQTVMAVPRKFCRLSALLAVIAAATVDLHARQGAVNAVTVAPSPVQAGVTVRATATGTGELCGALNIDWGDGTAITYATSTLPITQTHIYKAAGTFAVRAQGMGNCSGTAATRVVVVEPPPPPAPPPAPAPSPAPSAPRLNAINLAMPFVEPRTAASITLEGSGTCRLTVDFGDGNSQEMNQPLPATLRHTYAVPGRYSIVATPAAPCTERRATTLDVGVRPANRIARVDVETPRGGPTTVRAITVQGAGRCPYVIDFGDGNTETREAALPDVIRHNYPAEGRYTVVANAAPPCSGIERTVFVVGTGGGGRDSGSPQAGVISGLEVRPQDARAGDQVTVLVNGSGTCTFVVDFDDGQSRRLTERLPYRFGYRYAAAGTYNVVVWTDAPCTGEGDTSIRVRRR